MSSTAGAETALADTWVEAALTDSTDLSAFVGNPDGTARIFDSYAPPPPTPRPAGFTEYPLVVWQLQDARDVVTGIGEHRFLVVATYLVKAVAAVDSYADLGLVAAAVDQALTTPHGVGIAGVVPGGKVLSSRRTTPVRYVEVVEGRQVRHMGGLYRIQIAID